jgi:hypothetical protein
MVDVIGFDFSNGVCSILYRKEIVNCDISFLNVDYLLDTSKHNFINNCDLVKVFELILRQLFDLGKETEEQLHNLYNKPVKFTHFVHKQFRCLTKELVFHNQK